MRRRFVVVGSVVLAIAAGLLLPARSKADTQTAHFIVTGAGPGGGSQVRVFQHDGTPTQIGFFAYPDGFTGGVHVAAGDLHEDGIDDIVTGAGAGGGPQVRIFFLDGEDSGVGFFPYPEGFSGGVYVAVGQTTVGQSRVGTIVTGAGPGGGPHVRVFKINPDTGDVIPFASFFAYPDGFTGGVQVATADLDGDGTDEIITGAGPGGGPQVRVWKIDPANGNVTPTTGFFAYPEGFGGGAFVGGATLSKEIVTGAGAGGGPQVRTFTGAGQPLVGFFAYPEAFGGGAHVAAGDLDTDGHDKIVTGAGAGGGPQVRVFNNDGSVAPVGFFAYPEGFGGGVFVGVGQVTITTPPTTTTTNPNSTLPTAAPLATPGVAGAGVSREGARAAARSLLSG